jgi:hypothetical protein
MVGKFESIVEGLTLYLVHVTPDFYTQAKTLCQGGGRECKSSQAKNDEFFHT